MNTEHRTAGRPRRVAAVGLVSAATLTYEVVLVRIFAIEQFHHFAYMVIGVAMLGFGASGALVAVLGRVSDRWAVRGFAWCSALTAIFLILSPALVHRISIDPTQLVWDAGAWRAMAVVYLSLAAPFGAGAMVILLALVLESEHPGGIYGASFIGSGVGAAAAVAILWVVAPIRAEALPAVLASLGAVAACWPVRRRDRRVPRYRRHTPSVASMVLVVLSLWAFWRPPWTLDISPYKGLPQVEAYPEATRVAERSSPLGWVVAVNAPAFRYAPGLSLAFPGSLPKQTALFVDADLAGAATVWESAAAARAVLDWLPSSLAYAVSAPDTVLVLGASDGTEVVNALVHGASMVTGLQYDPQLSQLARTWAPLPSLPGTVEWSVGDARRFVARTPQRFDLILVGPGGAFGTSGAGVHALNEDFLHTTDAYERYLDRLTAGGMFVVTRWLAVPPRESVRVVLTAGEALRARSPQAARDGLIVARGWGTATVLVKPSGFSSGAIDSAMRWAEPQNVDLDWYPGLAVPLSRFNTLDEPVLFRAAMAATSVSEAEQFAAAYPFRVAPVDDARPYPHHFLRPSSVRSFVQTGRGNWLPFAEWGYVALLATLAQSIVLAGALTLLPAAITLGRRGARPVWPVVGYFTSIGFAFMAAEVSAIQLLSLLLGHPVYAVAAVFAVFLICSGVGSIWSDRLDARRGWVIGVTLVVLLTLCAVGLLALVHLVQGVHLVLRATVAILVLAPLAFLMGAPFPVGLRSLAGTAEVRVAWAWAANGFAAVVATPVAALIALEAGSAVLLAAAAGGYGIASCVHYGETRGRWGGESAEAS